MQSSPQIGFCIGIGRIGPEMNSHLLPELGRIPMQHNNSQQCLQPFGIYPSDGSFIRRKAKFSQ
jgi:hypothetical protein